MSTSISVAGRELIAAWTKLDRGLCAFVLALDAFDASCTWAEDGHASCASWLSDKCEMSRSEAFAKLKVSRELTRRHVVRVAFEEGLPYTKVFWLVRLDGVDHARDEEFVRHAKTDSARVLEERVNNWNYYARQDAKPRNLDDHYGPLRSRGVCGGLGKVTLEAPDDMLDRFLAVVDAYGEFLHRNKHGEQSGDQTLPHFRETEEGGYAYEGDETVPVTDGVDVKEPRALGEEEGPQPAERRPRSALRLDWLLDLLEEVALAEPKKIDPYIASVGVTIQYEDLIAKTGNGLSAQGSTLTAEAVRRLCCDAGIVRVVVKGQSEILDFGQEESLFNRAMRRAIRFRHGHCCAVKGCGRRVTFIHHIDHFEDGGETHIHNGIPLCAYHHHLVHEGGWQIIWTPTTGAVTLEGPRGQTLETTASFITAA